MFFGTFPAIAQQQHPQACHAQPIQHGSVRNRNINPAYPRETVRGIADILDCQQEQDRVDGHGQAGGHRSVRPDQAGNGQDRQRHQGVEHTGVPGRISLGGIEQTFVDVRKGKEPQNNQSSAQEKDQFPDGDVEHDEKVKVCFMRISSVTELFYA